MNFFVFDELADEFPARVFALVLALHGHLLIHGQQLAALDVHERRGHDEKLAGEVEVEHPHDLDVFDELRGELREVDLVDVHLLLLDEVEEEVERAFKDLELDFVIGHAPPMRAAIGARILKGPPELWQRFSRRQR